jgi:hypothetical protein
MVSKVLADHPQLTLYVVTAFAAQVVVRIRTR